MRRRGRLSRTRPSDSPRPARNWTQPTGPRNTQLPDEPLWRACTAGATAGVVADTAPGTTADLRPGVTPRRTQTAAPTGAAAAIGAAAAGAGAAATGAAAAVTGAAAMAVAEAGKRAVTEPEQL